MPENKSEDVARTLITLRGERTSQDIQLVHRLLARMGLDPKIVDAYDQMQSQETTGSRKAPIDAIKTEEDYMGREHFISYQRFYAPEFSGQIAARLFHIATDKDVGFEFGLFTTDRESAGLGPIPTGYWPAEAYVVPRAKWAVRAGDVVSFSRQALRGPRPYGLGAKTFAYSLELSAFLEERFQTETQA